MNTYQVSWTINAISAENARQAAEIALEILRDPASIALAFDVADENTGEETIVDLWCQHSDFTENQDGDRTCRDCGEKAEA